MNAFPIGLSALATGQRALELIGQNIANATTPGYHRQATNLVSRNYGGKVGAGVDVATITRYTSQPTRTAILRGNADQGAVSARLDVRRQVETAFSAGTGGIGDELENFFTQVERLTAHPDDSAVRRTALATASSLAGQFNLAAGDVDRLRADVGTQVSQTVKEVNDFATRIADLNVRIAVATQRGDQPNDLTDQRDQLVDQLSQRIDIKTVPQPFGVVNVLSSGTAVVVGETPIQFQVGAGAGGTLALSQTGTNKPVSFASGKLAGLMQEYNTDLPAARGRLDAVAGSLVQKLNQIQATGLGTSGPVTSADGTIGVVDPTQPLATQNLPFPVQAGNLTVSVTDATGNRTNTTLAIDPATMSLNDVATALSGVPGLTASVDAPTGTLRVAAQSGFAFDFAGRDTLPAGGGAVANPDTSNLLSGLGVNGLFNGTDATSIAVKPEILSDPRLLAGSLSGQVGDAKNLERMASVRDQTAISGRSLTAEFTDIAATVGTDVRSLGDTQTAQGSVLQNLNAQEQGVTGVDMNEELVHLLDFQRLIEGASKYMSAVNTALDSLMNIIR